MSVDEKLQLVRVFERPGQRSFIPKGPDHFVFDIPQNYMTSTRLQSLSSDIVSKLGEGDDVTHVPIAKITLPDFSLQNQLQHNEPFSDFLPLHRRLAADLIQKFTDAPTLSDLLSLAVYARDNVNPFVFNYAYSVALMHRPDTNDIQLPSLAEVFPEQFVGNGIFTAVRQEVAMFSEGEREAIEVTQDTDSVSNVDVENRLAYFREDVGINLHHWHWHLVYPFEGTRAMVDKDRRGELFYYMHQQILARYNLERFSNHMPRVRRLNNLRVPIPEGYFPNLDHVVSNKNWPGRPANSILFDVDRDDQQVQIDIADVERWKERIYNAIHSGSVINAQGQQMLLTEMGGINVLGNMVEASILSPNRNIYGNLHNSGHILIANITDPENRKLEGSGVMGNSATAMRDPTFYRWHMMVNNIFEEHKATLPRYTVKQLDYPGVRVTDVEVRVSDGTRNLVRTFWQQSDIDLSRGLDFESNGPIFARFKHLQHQPFSYKITVENSGVARAGTVRIFLGPKVDERGLPMLFRVQKKFFVELDRFQINMHPRTNVIERQSIDSSVTIPFERTFRNLNANRPAEKTAALNQFNFCSCGWPDHMLLPRGTTEGKEFQLFVMVSDSSIDRVNQSVKGVCTDSFSFCGLRDKLYPDKRSMGYPFDRMPRDGVEYLDKFLTPNMIVEDVTIQFNDRIEVLRSAQPRSQ